MILALTLILTALLPCLTAADSKEDLRLEFNVHDDHFARQETTPTFPPNTLPPVRTGTSTGAQPSGTPTLVFGIIDTLTTCQSASILWTFAGPKTPITLTITNAGVVQEGPPTSSATGNTASNTFSNTLSDDAPIPGGGVGGARTRAARAEPTGSDYLISTIATSVDADSERIIWSEVTVPQGWYTIIATLTDAGDSPSGLFLARSRNIFVQNGTDVSCLTVSPTGGSPSTSAPTGSPTSREGSENTSAPVGAAQSHVNTGAIAGGVVGAVALLAIVAAVLLCMRYRRNKAGVSASTAGDGEGGNSKSGKPGFLGAWGKLGSGSFNDKDKASSGARGNGAGNEAVDSMSAVGPKASGNDRGVAKSGCALAGASLAHAGHQRSRSKSGGSPVSTNAASSGTPASVGVVGSVAGFFGAKRTAPSSPPVANKKSKAKKPYGSNSRHNSHSESIGGMLSATSTMTSSSAFHGTEEEYNYNPYDERGLGGGVPLSPITAGGSATSSVRDRDPTTSSHGLPVFRSPFSDPETATNDSDSVVYGLHGTTRTHRDSTGMMGIIPIAYEPSSIAPSPSPVPSSYLHYDSTRSSAGAVAGHSSPSLDPPSRRNSRSNRLHTSDDSSSTFERECARAQSHSYSAFRDRDPQRSERERAQTLLSMYHPNSPIPHSSTPQSVPETPRNDSLLTFTSSSSDRSSSRKHKSKSMQDPATELFDMSSQQVPMQATSSQPANESTNTFGRTRRTPRKPVPSYSPEDPSYFTTIPHDSAPSHKHNNASASSIPSPVSPASPISPTTTQETATLRGSEGKHMSYVEGISEGQMNVYKQHELLHKDSMGSIGGGKKMMHLLIPDMPPPQRG